MFEYPFGNGQQLNLDWFLAEWKNLLAAWEAEKNGIAGALDAEIAKAEAALADVFAARDAAAQSASDASGYLATVRADANIARNAAQNAAQSESNAADSASAAAESQTAAGNSASAAAQSAEDAENAASSVEASAQQIATNTGDIANLKTIIVNPNAFPWVKPEYKKITMDGGGTVEKFGSVFRVNGARGSSQLIDLRELKTAIATTLENFTLTKQVILRVRISGIVTTTITGTQIYVNIYYAGTSNVVARIGNRLNIEAGQYLTLCDEEIVPASAVPVDVTLALQLRATVFQNLIVAVDMIPYSDAANTLALSNLSNDAKDTFETVKE